ncbi:hypothetical protein L614_000600000970 [Ochrobactrum sp. J50]|jgi:hypothetical protein|nr:hypothetical protein L614_000600000970 [Ochrobactrum sp. J50]
MFRKTKGPQPLGDIVCGFSNNGANCLFIFIEAVIKFRHLLRLGAFEEGTPPQRVHRRGAVFIWGVESAYQQCKLVN